MSSTGRPSTDTWRRSSSKFPAVAAGATWSTSRARSSTANESRPPTLHSCVLILAESDRSPSAYSARSRCSLRSETLTNRPLEDAERGSQRRLGHDREAVLDVVAHQRPVVVRGDVGDPV